MAGGLIRILRGAALALVVLWALHTVIVTGSLLLNAHYGELLRGKPIGAPHAPLSNLIQDATPNLAATLPKDASVLVLVDPEETSGFAYFWLTYWLFPRHIDETADLSAAATTRDGAIVYFARAGSPDLPPPGPFQLLSDRPGADGGRVIVYVREGGGP